MKKLAIVSSYNEMCGNASYTHVLKNAFSEHVEVEVIPLDLFLLQKRGRIYQQHGDKHIKDIVKRFEDFDYVNIQFEAGLFGRGHEIVLRRIKMLINAAKNLVLTMHRVDPPEMGDLELIGEILKRKMWPRDAWAVHERARHSKLYRAVIDCCKERSKSANTWIFVHTRREKRLVKDIIGFENVMNFPITFLQENERRDVLQMNDPTAFRRKHHVPEGAKVIGAFGFVTKYKGYETLLNALQYLPERYHLYIFGGQHPQSISANVELHPYLQTLIKRMGGVEERVHFVGSLNDPDFIEALHFSDATVLPYLEVGQSMSGVISLAIEADANLFCTNNFSFNEVRKDMGDVFHTFDIGNYMELAEKIQFAKRDFSEQRNKAFKEFNIKKNVLKHLEAFGHFKS